MHIFGIWGALMFLVGFTLAATLGTLKVIALVEHKAAQLVADSPFFYIALTCMILGTQLFLAGFISELVSRSASDRNKYLVDEEI